MSKVSVIIPAKNEEFLGNTIQSILDASQGEVQIVAVLDAWTPDLPLHFLEDNVQFLHFKDGIGQREAINQGVSYCDGDYILKTDAHSILSPGFDTALTSLCEDDMTIIPRMINLHAFDWVCNDCGATYDNCGTPDICKKCKGNHFTRSLVWTPKWHK